MKLQTEQRREESKPSRERNTSEIVANIDRGLTSVSIIVNRVWSVAKRPVGDVVLVAGFQARIFHRPSNENGDDIILRYARLTDRAS